MTRDSNFLGSGSIRISNLDLFRLRNLGSNIMLPLVIQPEAVSPVMTFLVSTNAADMLPGLSAGIYPPSVLDGKRQKFFYLYFPINELGFKSLVNQWKCFRVFLYDFPL